MKFNTALTVAWVLTALGPFACGGAEEDFGTNESALIRGGGGTGNGFECNTPGFPEMCSCTGPITSQDCQDMADNCSDEIICGTLVENCVCPMWGYKTPTPPIVVTPLPGGGGGKVKP